MSPAVRALVRGEVRDVHTARAAARGYRSGEFFSDAEGELGVVGPEPVRRFDRTAAR